MILWLTINSVALVILASILFLIVRQIGFILNHLGPLGAREMAQGPRIGENIAAHTQHFEGVSSEGVPTLYVFASTSCPICKTVREAAKGIARHWQADARVIMIYDANPTEDGQGILKADGSLWVTQVCDLREKLNVHAVPYAVMTDPAGVVNGHGLVNNASHLESLLEQWQRSCPNAETGVTGAFHSANT